MKLEGACPYQKTIAVSNYSAITICNCENCIYFEDICDERNCDYQEE